MVRRVQQLPDPRPLPPIAVDAVPVRLMGWVHDQTAFAFAIEPDVDGKYQAAILSFATGKPVRAWGCDTAEEAQRIAAQEFAVAAYGAPPNAGFLRTPKGPPPSGPRH